MPRFSSRQRKQPQKDRESMKPPKQPKQSLTAEMGNRIKQLSDARLEKQREELNQRFKQQEDEMMAQMYGPNWRTKKLPGDPDTAKAPTPQVDEFDSEYYDDPRSRRAS